MTAEMEQLVVQLAVYMLQVLSHTVMLVIISETKFHNTCSARICTDTRGLGPDVCSYSSTATQVLCTTAACCVSHSPIMRCIHVICMLVINHYTILQAVTWWLTLSKELLLLRFLSGREFLLAVSKQHMARNQISHLWNKDKAFQYTSCGKT